MFNLCAQLLNTQEKTVRHIRWTWLFSTLGRFLVVGTCALFNGGAWAASPLVSVWPDGRHVLVQQVDGQVKLWTSPAVTEQILGPTGTMQPVPELSNVHSVSPNYSGAVLRTADGKYFLWGWMPNDVWGTGDHQQFDRPTLSITSSEHLEIANFRLPFLSYSPTCLHGLIGPDGVYTPGVGCYTQGRVARSRDGSVWFNGWEDAGLPSGIVTVPEIQLPELNNVVSLATPYDRVVALKSDGTVWQWGRLYTNTSHQDLTRPAQVAGLNGIVQIYGGDKGDTFPASLAVAADGRVWAWGSGLRLLALPDRTDPLTFGDDPRPQPIEIPELRGAIQFSGDSSGLFTLKSDGTVWYVGKKNERCTQGNGAELAIQYDSHQLVLLRAGQVPGLSDVVAISTAPDGVVALKSDGQLWFRGGYPFWNDSNATEGCNLVKLPNQQTQRVSVSAPSTAVLSPGQVLAKLTLSNDSVAPLTLSPYLKETTDILYLPSEEEFLLATYGARESDDSRRVGFPDVTLAVGESKTLQIPLMVTMPRLAQDAEAVSLEIVFGASHGTLESTALLRLQASARTEPEPASDLMRRLATAPVADVGNAHLSQARNIDTELPSLGGDFWNYWVYNTMAAKPAGDEDKKFYYKLRRLGLPAREAYAVLYLRAISRLKPERAGRTQWFKIAKGSAELWKEIKKGQLGLTPDFNVPAKTLLEGIDSVNALYLLNLLELNPAYSEPLVRAVQDNLTAFGSTYSSTTLALCNYMGGDPLTGVPFAKLVEADLSHHMATRGQWHPKIHRSLFSRVTLRGEDGQDITLSRFLETFMERYQTLNSGIPGCSPVDAQRHWVRIQVHSPLLPLVTNASGQQFGVTADGDLQETIGHAFIDPGHPWTLAVQAQEGDLRVDYQVAYAFPFGVQLQAMTDGAVTAEVVVQGQAHEGMSLSQVGQVLKQANQTLDLRISSSADNTTPSQAERVFAWAEATLPQEFAPGPRTQTQEGYLYRHYPLTGAYLAVAETGGNLLYLGSLYVGVLNLGPLTQWLDMAQAAGF